MKQTLALVIACVLLFTLISSCHTAPAHHTETVASTKIDTAAFITLFKPLKFDSLSLVSNFDSFENKNSLLYGRVIDTIYRDMFPDTIQQLHSYFMHGTDIYSAAYALGRFDLDADREGYLLRFPGESYPSKIMLLIFDRQKRKFLDQYLQLAENWGDEGDLTVTSSVLHKKGSTLLINISEADSYHEEHDTAFNTLIRTQSQTVYRVAQGGISQVGYTELMRDTVKMGSEAPIDTTSVSSDK